jgi:hypothetical protein
MRNNNQERKGELWLLVVFVVLVVLALFRAFRR